jgi:methyl-accepting chemotaxis protein
MTQSDNLLVGLKGSFWRRLGVTMTFRMVVAALVPLIIVSVVVALSLTRMIEDLQAGIVRSRQSMAYDTVGAFLESQADFAMDEIDDTMYGQVHSVSEWSKAPAIRQAVTDGDREAQRRGLIHMSSERVEEVMQETRALVENRYLTVYLQDLVRSNPIFSEIILTESHGFTVAYDQMPDRFNWQETDWWKGAWEDEWYIGDPVCKSQCFMDIAWQVEDEEGPRGVLKATLNIKMLHYDLDRIAGKIEGGEIRLFDQDGYLIADTESQHDPALMMSEAGNLKARAWDVALQVLESPSAMRGSLMGRKNLNGEPVGVGYAFAASGEVYGLSEFEGFPWIIIVEQLEEAAFAPLRPLDEHIERMSAAQSDLLWLLLGFGVLTIVVTAVGASFSAQAIVSPIERLVEFSQQVAVGDFSAEIEVQQHGEIGQLQRAFWDMTSRLRQMLENEREQRERLQATVAEYMIFVADVARGNLSARLTLETYGSRDDPLVILGENLNEMVAHLEEVNIEIKAMAQKLGSAASEILASTTQQSSSASEQSAAISQTTTTVDELKTIAEQSVARAQDVANASQRTVEVSRTGRQAVDNSIESMIKIRNQVEGIAENILALSEQTQQIGEITATVNDIAAQSNMLALNASVEAARAGEYGKGFAVVAQEVRNLAEQSKQATAQIKSILSDIQKATNATVMATEEGTKSVEEGVNLVGQAQEVIDQLAGVIEESAQAAMQLVAGGRQQASGVEQIALAMQNINQATAQTLSSTRQAEKISRELNQFADDLLDSIY